MIFKCLITISLCILLVACTIQQNISEVYIPDLETSIDFSTNYICPADWSNINSLPQFKIDYVSKWVEQLWREDPIHKEENLKQCIEEQQNAKCFLLYAMYNNKLDLCEHFPELYTAEYRGPGGTELQECHYRDICKAFVKIFNE